ncbi:MAG: hypothetical protein WCG90_08310 [Chitinophagia bacterium]
MKKLLLLLLIPVFASAQSKCDRSTAFTADFTFQSNVAVTRLNASVNIGVSGFNQVGEKYNRISLLGGLRIYDADLTQRTATANSEVFVIPTATMLFKHRFNGYDSKLVHAVGITAGGNNYIETSYRVYAAPNGNSFATVGGLIAYSNIQGFTVGFVIMGLF